MVLSLCADIPRLHLSVAYFYLAPLRIAMNQFLETSASVACISPVQANRGISSCLHRRTSKRAIPSEHRIRVHTAGTHAKTHSQAYTHTYTHRRVHTAGMREEVPSCFHTAFPYMLIAFLLLCRNSRWCDEVMSCPGCREEDRQG